MDSPLKEEIVANKFSNTQSFDTRNGKHLGHSLSTLSMPRRDSSLTRDKSDKIIPTQSGIKPNPPPRPLFLECHSKLLTTADSVGLVREGLN